MMENILKLNPVVENILKNKVIVVTGAGSGLGKAICLGLPYSGVKLGLIDIDEETLNETANAISQAGGEGFVMHASVTDEKTLSKKYEELVKKFGKIDALINVAGIAKLGGIDKLDYETIKLSNDVNINGYYLNASLASKNMNDNGSIINISSNSARGVSKHSSLYSVAKEAQCAMVRSWAMDLGERGINVNALLLGDLFGNESLGIHSKIWNQKYFEEKAIDKGLVKKDDSRLGGEKLNEEIREMVINHYVGRTALKKQLKYRDIVHQIIFLISPLGEKITGESITITSGNPNSFSR
ncbi:MAG: SDR family oxidoreductase [archaeon]